MKRGTTVASLALVIVLGAAALPVSADDPVLKFLCDEEGCRVVAVCEPAILTVCIEIKRTSTPYYAADRGEVDVEIRVDSYSGGGYLITCISERHVADVYYNNIESGTSTCDELEDLGFEYDHNVLPWTGVHSDPQYANEGSSDVLLYSCDAEIMVVVAGSGVHRTEKVPCP